MRLPPIQQLCDLCAAYPSIPCPDGVQRYLIGCVHAGDREFADLLLLADLTSGLREFAMSVTGRPGGSDGA
jgi:hypothetical protein